MGTLCSVVSLLVCQQPCVSAVAKCLKSHLESVQQNEVGLATLTRFPSQAQNVFLFLLVVLTTQLPLSLLTAAALHVMCSVLSFEDLLPWSFHVSIHRSLLQAEEMQ